MAMFPNLRNFHLYLMLLADVALFALSLAMSYLLRFDFQPAPQHWSQVAYILIVSVPVKGFFFFTFGLYRGMWRYTDILDFWRLFQAVVVSTLSIVTVIVMVTRFQGVPRSVVFIDAVLTFLFCGGLRVGIRSLFRVREQLSLSFFIPWKTLYKQQSGRSRVLMVGAGDAGEKVLREIIENPALTYDVVGFLDDDSSKSSRTVHGVPVVGTTRDLESVVRKKHVDQVFITMPTASGQDMRRVVQACESLEVQCKTLPGMGEILEGKVGVSNLREVRFEDLLGRDPISLDTSKISAYVQGKTVLISGAGGSIGSELCRQLIRFQPARLILFDASELNLYTLQNELETELGFFSLVPVLGRIQDEWLTNSVCDRYRPEVVFHAAAYKHVPMLEQNPWEAVQNNVCGSLLLMRAAHNTGVDRFVVVSTDKAVRPTSVMGASKRITELLMHEFNNHKGPTKFMAVRFGNVVGSSGSVVPLFQRQIARGGPVRITHAEAIRYFMTISESAQLIIQAGALGRGGEIFVLDMGTPIKIADMARDLIRLMGKEPDKDIEIVYTGLRPGEKIFEELITDEEGIERSEHSKIMVLRRGGSDRDHQYSCNKDRDLFIMIDELSQAALSQDHALIRDRIRDIVPEYQPYWSMQGFNQECAD